MSAGRRRNKAVRGGDLPTQQQVRWSQLRVGLVVIFASVTLAILIFLMTGATGLFTKKITLYAYFDNAQGLRVGAPVRLAGVDIGNVTDTRIVPRRLANPVQATMRVNTRYQEALRQSSIATLETAGVLGETFIDISTPPSNEESLGAPLRDGATLRTEEQPALQDVVRASQTTLQNVEILVRRLDRIVAQVESGKGSIGNFIYDDQLYRRLNMTVNEVQAIVNQVGNGQGSIGKLVANDDLYNKANAAVDKVNAILDSVQAGQGTLGMVLKDPSLYNNANATISKANQLMTDINSGKGTIGKLTRDEAFAQKLDNTITRLSEITQKINTGQGTAARLLTDPSLYTNADQMLVETRNLLTAIRQNPKKYLTIHFRIF